MSWSLSINRSTFVFFPLASGATTGNGSPDPDGWCQPAGLHGPPEETGCFQRCIDGFVPPHREEERSDLTCRDPVTFPQRKKSQTQRFYCNVLDLTVPLLAPYVTSLKRKAFLTRKQVTFVVLFSNLLFMRNGSSTLEADCPYVSNIKTFSSPRLYVIPLLND